MSNANKLPFVQADHDVGVVLIEDMRPNSFADYPDNFQNEAKLNSILGGVSHKYIAVGAGLPRRATSPMVPAAAQFIYGSTLR